MTWKELQNHISVMDEKQLNSSPLVLDSNTGQLCHINSIDFVGSLTGIEADDVEKNTPYLNFDS